MTLYEKTVGFVNNTFLNKNIKHFELTVYYLDQFLPNITEGQKIAAYSHDIERANREKDEMYMKSYLDPAGLKHHQEKGAEIVADFLKTEGADDIIIEKVKHLVSHHEEGGDAEQDALMDADSVSFFETNAEMFVNKKAPTEGYKKVKEKLDWMFSRIKSPMAREAARINYERWSKELDDKFKK